MPPPAPAKALPLVTYDGPVTLHVNGEDVQLIPIRAAHTDGDTVIRFPKHNVLAVGDYYRSVGYPFVDIFNGGTLEGLLAGLDETIGSRGAKDEDHSGSRADRRPRRGHRAARSCARDARSHASTRCPGNDESRCLRRISRLALRSPFRLARRRRSSSSVGYIRS